jgi:hypothetical protein
MPRSDCPCTIPFLGVAPQPHRSLQGTGAILCECACRYRRVLSGDGCKFLREGPEIKRYDYESIEDVFKYKENIWAG